MGNNRLFVLSYHLCLSLKVPVWTCIPEELICVFARHRGRVRHTANTCLGQFYRKRLPACLCIKLGNRPLSIFEGNTGIGDSFDERLNETWERFRVFGAGRWGDNTALGTSKNWGLTVVGAFTGEKYQRNAALIERNTVRDVSFAESKSPNLRLLRNAGSLA